MTSPGKYTIRIRFIQKYNGTTDKKLRIILKITRKPPHQCRTRCK